MSLFKRILSSVGIGGAKVDTILQGESFVPGEEIDAIVKIKGGSTDQEIGGLYFSILSTYEATETDDEEGEEETVTRVAELSKFKVKDDFTLGPGQEDEIELSFELPPHTPFTLGKTRVWVRTGLDVKMAIDPGDEDYIRVVPDHLLSALFSSMEELGFELVEAECEEVPSSFPTPLPFVQELEFKPRSGPYRGRLDEIELVCLPGDNGWDVHMEIDRKARNIASFISEMVGTDESRVRFTLTEEDLPGLTGRLNEFIDGWS
ncbi:MAG: sporulation protein [Desulfobacteraceae bacterium]|nr:sporulation protein [Desulfobacteraceae bacterium]